MSLTREQIEAVRQHWCDVPEDLRNHPAVRKYNIVCDLALDAIEDALTARAEGFREGVEAAAWAIGELDGGEPERDRALNEAIATVRALTPREPNDGGERG